MGVEEKKGPAKAETRELLDFLLAPVSHTSLANHQALLWSLRDECKNLKRLK